MRFQFHSPALLLAAIIIFAFGATTAVIFIAATQPAVQAALVGRAGQLPLTRDDSGERLLVVTVYEFTPARQQAWRRLMEEAFQPGHFEQPLETPQNIGVRSEGIELALPAYPWSGALSLGFAAQGRRLFGTRDVKLVEELAEIAAAAHADRLSYQKGPRRNGDGDRRDPRHVAEYLCVPYQVDLPQAQCIEPCGSCDRGRSPGTGLGAVEHAPFGIEEIASRGGQNALMSVPTVTCGKLFPLKFSMAN